jgi:tetratricopeptide (TPR) repeat protein
MPDKKKSIAVKTKNTERRMTQPQTSQAAKTAEPKRAAGTPARPKDAGPPPQNGPRQLDSFEAGMKLFHARKLKDAREQFVEAEAGPERDVAQRARLHIAMCDRRLQKAIVHLGSAEDYYNYGVALLNARNVAEARTHLEKALQIAPGADHIHYALAVAQALSGDVVNAFENLRRSIELEPRNRIIARQDADFGPLAHQSPFESLLYPEKKNSW